MASMALTKTEKKDYLNLLDALINLPIKRIPGVLNGEEPSETTILYRKSRKVEITTEGLKKADKTIQKMELTLKEWRKITGTGRALAANQVGSDLAICVFLLTDGKTEHFINPEIVWKSKEKNVYWEMCLSGSPLGVDVTRPEKVSVKWYTLDGERHEKTFDGFDARRLQHEIEHLDGKTCYTSDGANPKTLGYHLDPSVYMNQELRPVKS